MTELLGIGLVVVVIVVAAVWLRRSLSSTISSQIVATQSPVVASSDAVSSIETEQLSSPRWEVIESGSAYEVRLDQWTLLTMELIAPTDIPARQSVKGPTALLLSRLLDEEVIRQVIGGGRYVLARIPDSIVDGSANWVRTVEGLTKGGARSVSTGTVVEWVTLVGEGAIAVGLTAALAPAVIGAIAVAYAQHRLEVALRGIRQGIDTLKAWGNEEDLGIVEAARSFMEEVSQWPSPHLWPEQLKTELAVRRTLVDGVYFKYEQRVKRHIRDLTRKGKFADLQEGVVDEHRWALLVFVNASLIRAQLEFCTTAIVLDSAFAPFGLEALLRSQERLAAQLESVSEAVSSALELGEPGWTRRLKRRRVLVAKTVLGQELERVQERLDELAEPNLGEVILSLDSSGELVIESADLESEISDDLG
jgi:hypothetical protein